VNAVLAPVLAGLLFVAVQPQAVAADAGKDQPAAAPDAAPRTAPEKTAEDTDTLRSVGHWLIRHVPKILLILVGLVAAQFVVRTFSHRIVKFMSRQAVRGSLKDRENRVETLVSVFRNTAAVALVVVAALMILDELGVSITPLLGGAAVLGLAIAFGTQNLIKDFFAGFMLLLEDQYGVNDYVTIGGISGVVERVTLRVTVLRDLDGTTHFIPHGAITTVSNATHAGSRAVFSVTVPSKDDVDRVMAMLTEQGKALRQDPVFGQWILSDPEMLGVDQLSDAAVVVKFVIETAPLKQWEVRRELLRRIKYKLDEMRAKA